MNISVVIVEAICFALLFTIMVFLIYGTDKKYLASSISNYPLDIQEEYYKTHKKVDEVIQKKRLLAKLLGSLMFIVILVLCSICANAKTFKDAFILALILMVWIGIYDTFFLDWVLFANMKIFRLEGTEHMDKSYHQKWFHLKGMLFPGLLIALIVGLIVGLIIQTIY